MNSARHAMYMLCCMQTQHLKILTRENLQIPALVAFNPDSFTFNTWWQSETLVSADHFSFGNPVFSRCYLGIEESFCLIQEREYSGRYSPDILHGFGPQLHNNGRPVSAWSKKIFIVFVMTYDVGDFLGSVIRDI